MTLGVITHDTKGGSDRLLADVAQAFTARGLRLAGCVQINLDCDGRDNCRMQVHILPDGPLRTISQDLGPMASGCRLDAAALEDVVGRVTASLDSGPDLLIVNKFGKQEAEGGGFRSLIGAALMRDIPVLTSVHPRNRAAFDAFAGDLAQPVAAEADAVLRWALSATGATLRVA